jgi:hypothetical protein
MHPRQEQPVAAWRALAAPGAILAFWCGMIAAAHAYQAGYDWRFQTISVLLYRDQNPHGYMWAWAGLELCGLAGFSWTVQLSTDRRCGIATCAMGLRVLQLGFLCMCCAVLPDRVLPWSKGHEAFAILAFLGICIGITWQMLSVVEPHSLGSRQGATRPAGTALRMFGALLPVAPLVLAASTQAYLAVARPDLPWVGPSWRARGISPLLSFGLWEWTSCAAFSISLLALSRRRAAL